MAKISEISSLLTCALMMLAVAVQRDARTLGVDVCQIASRVRGVATDTAAATVAEDGGHAVVSTAETGKSITGYAGPTPVYIYIDDGRVTKVEAQKNSETPMFFERVERELLTRWDGMTVAEATAAQVDGVSGATLSSDAVIANVRLGLLTYSDRQAADHRGSRWMANAFSAGVWSKPQTWGAVAVILSACIVPLLLTTRRRGTSPKAIRRYHVAQLVLNVVVLGLWSGTFLSYSMLVGILANGIGGSTAVVTVLLLVVAFVYPLAGKKRHYCTHLCPLGSAQELAMVAFPTGRRKRLAARMGVTPKRMRTLSHLREVLWAVLMLMMWCGVCFAWMDYELFTAFLVEQASPVIVAVAVAVVLLSCIVPRPYCRLVCPTGTLFQLSDNTK